MPEMSFDIKTKSYAQGIKGLMVTGTSYLTTISASTLSAKTVMYSTFIDPFSLATTRLTGIARQFLKWKPISITFSFIPSVPSTSGGSYSLSVIPDPNYPLYYTGDDLLRRVLSIDHSVLCNLFTPTSTKFSWYEDEPWYYLEDSGGDLRFSTPALFTLCCVNAPLLDDLSDVGTLVVSYEIALCGSTYDLSEPTTTGTYTENSMTSSDFKTWKLDTTKFTPSPGAVPVVSLRLTALSSSQLVFQTLSGVAISLKVGSVLYAFQTDVANTWLVCLFPNQSESSILMWKNPMSAQTGSFSCTYQVVNP